MSDADADLITVHTVVFAGKSVPLRISRHAPVRELVRAIVERDGMPDKAADSLVLHAQGKTLLPDKYLQDFNVQHNSNVYVLARVPGGGQLEPEVLRMVLSCDLKDAIKSAPKEKATCCICIDERPCVKTCETCKESRMCGECVELHLKSCDNFEPRCPTCRNPGLSLEKMLPSGSDLLVPLAALRDITALVRHIDVQLCACGQLMVNTGKFSRTVCPNEGCKRHFCFFCNEKWDATKMKNAKYSCGDKCHYTGLLSFELLPMAKYAQEPDVLVPGMRICPGCGEPGGYGNLCKYHTCGRCKLEFCFICLKSKAECPKGYGRMCVAKADIPKQDYSAFKHFASA